MLLGVPPFVTLEGLSRQKLYRKIMEEDVNYPSSLSSDVIDLIKGLLTKDPRKRLTLE
jgi:serine/threonine protein kinase